MVAETTEDRVDNLLRGLFLPENGALLENYRLKRGRKRAYSIPLNHTGKDFIILKLRPTRGMKLWRRAQRLFLSRMYGEKFVLVKIDHVQVETERYREWQREGFCVPRLIETSIPGIRVFQGLEHPFFYDILADKDVTPSRKLEILGAVVRTMSLQHRTAYKKDRKSLVHWDPGPHNIMFDMDRGITHWCDLEDPVQPNMSLEGLMVRAVRIFIFGVLHHLWEEFDDTIEVFCENYELDFVLRQLADNVERSRSSLMGRVMEGVRIRRPAHRVRRLISSKIRECLEKKALSYQRGRDSSLARLVDGGVS